MAETPARRHRRLAAIAWPYGAPAVARVCAPLLLCVRVLAAIGTNADHDTRGALFEARYALTRMWDALCLNAADVRLARTLTDALLGRTLDELVLRMELLPLDPHTMARAAESLRWLLDAALDSADGAVGRPCPRVRHKRVFARWKRGV